MLQDGMLLVNEETHSWLVFASTVGIDFERRKMKKNRFTNTQLAIAGLMIALTIILSYQNIYLFPPRSGRITLRFIPMIFSGIILGPTLGTIIGGASDPLIYFMTLGSPGMYFPGYMLTNMIMGFFPGLILGKNIEKESKLSITLKVALISIFSFVVTILLDSFWLSLTRGKGFWYYVVSRTVPNLIQMAITFVAILVLSTRIKKTYR